ncbi:MAG: DNA-3-methyladenine glycosylase [Candidatus Saccharimonadales bacterium]
MRPRELDLSDAYLAAQNLLGWKLVHQSPQGRTAGYIVETEVYTMDDPASHAHHGETPRNTAMFQESGTIYVYFTYGLHHGVNIVTGIKGHGQGVLIRAIEPVEGIELMKMRRNTQNNKILTNGPGKLTQAMGINLELRGTDIDTGPIFIEPGIKPVEIIQTTRVGISKAQSKPWRFYIYGNPNVSKLVRL